MLNFVVCDDDIHMLDRISSLLEKVIIANDFDAKIVYKTTDFKKLLSYISENIVNVVILDIEFYGHSENGLDVAKQIRFFNKNCYLIFITSHFEYIAEAYKYTTFDYIFKYCLNTETLTTTLSRLFDDVSASESKFLKIDNKNTFIDLNDVQYIEKRGAKIIYHTSKTDYITYNSFNKLKLPKNFVRCHKSFIANINNISKISFNDNIIHFKNNSICYIGPKYRNVLKEVMDIVTIS